jgi:glycine cleavage system T protein (aminomethyltransferase)
MQSAFHAIGVAEGATFVEEGGWWWTDSYGDLDAEYRAVRHGVGVWDLSPLNKWEFRGADALEAVQRVHSNDVWGMVDGQVRYGAFLDEDGLLIDDGTVFRFSAERLWVMTNVMEREEYFADATKGLAVSVTYLGADLPSLQIQGPRSRDLVRGLTDADIDALAYFRFIPREVRVGGAPVIVSRTGFSGELGYELFLAPRHAEQVWEAVRGAGAVPYGVGIIEPVRVEVGMIVTGYDYEEHRRSPFDLGLDRMVALEAEGEFMGKDRLRELAKTPPNRFKTLRLGAGELPPYGATVTRDGEEVGILTSPAESPALGPIGLAILRADAAADGTHLTVAAQGGPRAATVDVLALYDPRKERPRA